MNFWSIPMWVIHRFQPETAHHLTIRGLWAFQPYFKFQADLFDYINYNQFDSEKNEKSSSLWWQFIGIVVLLIIFLQIFGLVLYSIGRFIFGKPR